MMRRWLEAAESRYLELMQTSKVARAQFCNAYSIQLAGVLRRLKVIVSGLPEQECRLPGEISERDNLFFREMAVVVVHLHQHGIS